MLTSSSALGSSSKVATDCEAVARHEQREQISTQRRAARPSRVIKPGVGTKPCGTLVPPCDRHGPTCSVLESGASSCQDICVAALLLDERRDVRQPEPIAGDSPSLELQRLLARDSLA